MAVPTPREVFLANMLGRAVVLAEGASGVSLETLWYGRLVWPLGMAVRGGSFVDRWGNGFSIRRSTAAPPDRGAPIFTNY
jgi:putative hemolysin